MPTIPALLSIPARCPSVPRNTPKRRWQASRQHLQVHACLQVFLDRLSRNRITMSSSHLVWCSVYCVCTCTCIHDGSVCGRWFGCGHGRRFLLLGRFVSKELSHTVHGSSLRGALFLSTHRKSVSWSTLSPTSFIIVFFHTFSPFFWWPSEFLAVVTLGKVFSTYVMLLFVIFSVSMASNAA